MSTFRDSFNTLQNIITIWLIYQVYIFIRRKQKLPLKSILSILKYFSTTLYEYRLLCKLSDLSSAFVIYLFFFLSPCFAFLPHPSLLPLTLSLWINALLCSGVFKEHFACRDVLHTLNSC